MSKRNLLLTISLALCVLVANFDVSAQNPVASESVAHQAGAGQTISLNVSFESAMSDFTACAICGDGFGDYSDGVNGVSAYISRYGHLYFYFHGGDASPRRVNFTYSPAQFYPSANHPTPDMSQLPAGAQSYGELVTFNAFTPYTPIQDMHVGDAPQCLMTGWALTQGSIGWDNGYHREYARFFDPLTSYVVVSCSAQDSTGKCTTWELEPIASACNNTTIPTLTNVQKITSTKKGSTYQDYGLWKMPFKITLTRR